jgi:hypothetical protein
MSVLLLIDAALQWNIAMDLTYSGKRYRLDPFTTLATLSNRTGVPPAFDHS